MENDDTLRDLLKKIDQLSLQVEKYKEEIYSIKNEVNRLYSTNMIQEPKPGKANSPIKQIHSKQTVRGLENFIGLKLINFVGIIVLIIGLTIGVKYVIDINLISPAMRIGLTYIAGTVLFLISLRLRKNYEVFSMILFSGSMASVYFTTFAAYEYYALISATPAFILMLVFTSFTVYNAIKYDKQEIAILGLVGAYGIPFFVRGNSENIIALFSYIFIINAGVLLISFKKYWLSLMYISFFTTWLIYLSWLSLYATGNNYTKGILFAFAFFSFFLLNSFAFKAIKRLSINSNDTFLIITNTVFLYFSLIVLYKAYGMQATENITLSFGIIYLLAALAVKRFFSAQHHLYNGFFCVSLTALITYAGIRYAGFTLTIVWVAMAVALFVAGVLFRLKLFRVAAILLFGATLVKLLLADSMKFNSIQKVSAYIIIGVVLLIISFLYQKYKKIIFGEKE